MAFKVLADNGISISAPQDGAMYNFFANNQNVILDGIGNEFAVSYTANSLVITVGTGEAIISGRSITATETNTLTLSANSTLYICLRIDLTQTAGNEGMIVALTSQDLIQSGNLNNGGNVCDILLGTVVTGTSGVTSFTDKRTIQPAAIPPTSTSGQVLASTENGFGWANAFNTSRKYCIVGSDVANTAGWYKVASGSASANMIFAVTNTYMNYFAGIFLLQIQVEGTAVYCRNALWLSRAGFPEDAIRVTATEGNWTLYVKQYFHQFARIMFEVISESTRFKEDPTYILYNSTTPEATEPVAIATSSDATQVVDTTDFGGNVNDLIPAEGQMIVRTVLSTATNIPVASNGIVVAYGFAGKAFAVQHFYSYGTKKEAYMRYLHSGIVFTDWELMATSDYVDTRLNNRYKFYTAVEGDTTSSILRQMPERSTWVILANDSSSLCEEVNSTAGSNTVITLYKYTSWSCNGIANLAGKFKIGTQGGTANSIVWRNVVTDNQLNTRLDGLTLKVLTQSEYDALETKDANTLYLVKEDA